MQFNPLILVFKWFSQDLRQFKGSLRNQIRQTIQGNFELLKEVKQVIDLIDI